MFGGFRNDPFFNDVDRQFAANIESMMMPGFMFDPFSHRNAVNNAIMGPQAQHPRHQRNELMRRDDPFMPAMNNPFALMNSMMTNMNSIFGNMDQMIHTASNDPNSQVYTHSSVMSYSNTGDGAPKVYQATSETKQLPGGIKETRRAVRDSEKGIEKMSLGHHIGQKAHVIERERKRDGQIEEIVNLENLDENEINEFNREFENKVSHGGRFAIDQHYRPHRSHNHNQPLAIDDGRTRKEKKKSKSKH